MEENKKEVKVPKLKENYMEALKGVIEQKAKVAELEEEAKKLGEKFQEEQRKRDSIEDKETGVFKVQEYATDKALNDLREKNKEAEDLKEKIKNTISVVKVAVERNVESLERKTLETQNEKKELEAEKDKIQKEKIKYENTITHYKNDTTYTEEQKENLFKNLDTKIQELEGKLVPINTRISDIETELPEYISQIDEMRDNLKYIDYDEIEKYEEHKAEKAQEEAKRKEIEEAKIAKEEAEKAKEEAKRAKEEAEKAKKEAEKMQENVAKEKEDREKRFSQKVEEKAKELEEKAKKIEADAKEVIENAAKESVARKKAENEKAKVETEAEKAKEELEKMKANVAKEKEAREKAEAEAKKAKEKLEEMKANVAKEKADREKAEEARRKAAEQAERRETNNPYREGEELPEWQTEGLDENGEEQEPEEIDNPEPFIPIIKISEAEDMIVHYKNEQGDTYNSTVKQALEEKKSKYDRLNIKGICKEIAGKRIASALLYRKINPSIIKAIENSPEMIHDYIEAIHNKEPLPFKLVHDLSGRSMIQRALANRFTRAEKASGARIIKTAQELTEGGRNERINQQGEPLEDYIEGKDVKNLDEKELFSENEERIPEKKTKRRKGKFTEEIEVSNEDGKIEEEARKNAENKEAELERVEGEIVSSGYQGKGIGE